MQYTVYIGSAHTLGVRGNVYREKECFIYRTS